jgi:hypothetical protein
MPGSEPKSRRRCADPGASAHGRRDHVGPLESGRHAQPRFCRWGRQQDAQSFGGRAIARTRLADDQRVGGGIRILSPARICVGSVICGFIFRTVLYGTPNQLTMLRRLSPARTV